MKTFADYKKRLGALHPNIHMGGQIVNRSDPRLEPPMSNIKLTYELAYDPKYQHLTTAVSHLTGKTINRFCHIHQSIDDLLKKQEMTRMLCQRTIACIQRCMGVDMLNAFSVVTKEVDEAKGTDYYPRFIEYLKFFQENDLVGCAAQTDVKGDRSLRPHEQKDPDLYLRVVEKRRDGIVVRGAKAHNSVAPYADEILVSPSRVLTAEEGDWAVCFAIPADTEGIHLVGLPSSPRPRKHFKAPVAEHGSCHPITIFDNVFVPWERVFMCGEWEFGGRAAHLFALYHRHSYTGCKPAYTDILMGAAALAAEYNGIARSQHVRHKLADYVSAAELVYATGIASAVKAQRASSGTYVPDTIFCNVARRHAGEQVYHEYEMLCDLAGGIPATLPSEEDFVDQFTGPLLNKYIMRKSDVPAEYQQRCFRMVADLACSSFGAHRQVAGLHGGGSPIMEEIALLTNYDMEAKKDIAKYLAGIPT